MKKNKRKSPVKNKNKKITSKAKVKSKSLKKPVKAAASKSRPQTTSKKNNQKSLNVKSKTKLKTKAKTSKLSGAALINSKRKLQPGSQSRSSSRVRPIEAQSEKRFKDIMDRERLHNTADAGEVFDSHEYAVMPRMMGLDEPGNLEDPSAPEDTVTAMERAEDEDTLASGELSIPERTEELALGDDDNEEDSDEPTTISKPDFENI